MSRLLAIDTSGAPGSIALIESGEVVGEVSFDAPDGFGSVLFLRLAAILADHGWELEDCNAFAAATGPGSFTGIRAGVAAVKGLAEALARPAFGVSTLQAIAAGGSAGRRAVCLDARRSEVYGAVYDANLEPVCAEVVAPIAQWLHLIGPAAPGELLSPHLAVFGDLLAAAQPEFAAIGPGSAVLAPAVGRIAWQRWQRGESGDPLALDANYVRRSDAEIFGLPSK